jgi:hypothetical protein
MQNNNNQSPEDIEDFVEIVLCDMCGGPCDGMDAVTDDFLSYCGSFYGNGCAEKFNV